MAIYLSGHKTARKPSTHFAFLQDNSFSNCEVQYYFNNKENIESIESREATRKIEKQLYNPCMSICLFMHVCVIFLQLLTFDESGFCKPKLIICLVGLSLKRGFNKAALIVHLSDVASVTVMLSHHFRQF